MSCPICGKRPPKRFCPAKGEKICPVCCGQEREVTIDCPVDCPHLIAGHRYEAEHRKPAPPQDFPHPDLQISPDFVYERWPLLTAIATAILRFTVEAKELHDAEILSALEALAETYRTLGTGIYYERPPDSTVARALYGQISQFVQDFRKNEAERAGFSSVKDGDVFRLLVFLLRVGKQETNGRPLSRAFLEFLRARFPLPSEVAHEPPRIIVP